MSCSITIIRTKLLLFKVKDYQDLFKQLVEDVQTLSHLLTRQYLLDTGKKKCVYDVKSYNVNNLFELIVMSLLAIE